MVLVWDMKYENLKPVVLQISSLMQKKSLIFEQEVIKLRISIFNKIDILHISVNER